MLLSMKCRNRITTSKLSHIDSILIKKIKPNVIELDNFLNKLMIKTFIKSLFKISLYMC